MTTITIRNVPDQARDELAARAASSGRSLQEYLRGELIELARRPDAATLMARVPRTKGGDRKSPLRRPDSSSPGCRSAVTTVMDASTVVAALVDGGPDGTWAESIVGHGDLAAPHLLPVEVANVLRRAEISGRISADVASLTYRALFDLPVVLLPFEPFAERVWALRPALSAYDAWYVAIAESLSAPLATLDAKLSRSPGPRCDFLMPDGPRSKRARPK